MKTKYLIACLWIVLVGCKNEVSQNQMHEAPSRKEVIKRGKYLVNIMGCNDCHSPKVFTEFGPVPDESRLLSGHPENIPVGNIPESALQDWVLFGMHNTVAVGPWGVSFAANISSDETGIGSWSYEQFKKAITEGKFKGLAAARMLLPPMPWPNYKEMEEADIQAVYAYLKSTRPVKNVVPAPIPPVVKN